ncbi:MAG: DUF4230 domain-containing protein [Rubrobacteraceae bacterium]
MDGYHFKDAREERKGGRASGRLATVLAALALAVVLGVGLARYGQELPVIGPIISGPDTTTTTPVSVEGIQDLNHLATVRRVGSVVVTEEAEPGRIQSLADSVGIDTSGLTGESVIVTATGEVEAGVDLEELREEDVRVNGDTVAIDLPEPEILSASLDEERTGVYDRDRGIFVYRGDDTLMEDARREAVAEVEDAAEESDILAQANSNAEDSIRAFVETLGFEEVRFE